MDENKTKERLLDELAAMHQRIAELEMSESERKRVEQALAHERDLLRALMDNIPDTIYFKDTASRFTRINRAQAQVLGVSDSREAIGKTDFDFFTSEHARDAYADEQEIVKSGQPLIDKVERIRRANGQARWVSATKVPITDEEGRVVGTVGISRDITERRQAEEALRESEENFRALAENANDGIMIAVGRGAHVYANKRMAEITGYSVAELLKTTMMDLVHPNDLQKVMERYRKRLEGKPAPRQYEIAIVRKDGQSVPLEITAAKTVWHEQPADIIVFRDITERKRAEEAMRRHNAELEALQRTSLQLTSSLDLSAVLDSIADSALSLVEATDCHIYLYDEASETFTFGVALWEDGRREAAVEMPRSDGLTATVAREGRSMVINDALQHPLYATPGAPEWGLQAIAGFPLKRAERVLGVFTIAFLKPHTFSEDELRLLGLLANQAAIAIENARLFEETSQRALQLQTVEEVGRRVSSILDLEELFPYVAKSIQQNFGYYHVDIFLVEPARGYAVFKASHDPAKDKVWKEQDVRFKIGQEGMIGWVAHTGEPLLANDVSQEPRYLPEELLAEVQSELVVPLKVEDQVVGVLDVGSNKLDAFDEDDIFVLQTLANQIAIAIENARLFEEEKRRATQLAVVNEVGDKAASILDLDRLMQEVTHSIQESFNYFIVALLLLDEERREVVIRAIAGGFEDIAPGEYRQSIDEGIIGFVVRTGKSWLAGDVSKDPYYVPGFAREVPTKSELCVPIKLGDKVIGALDVQSTRLNAFDQADVVAMEAIADRVAIGIENARLYEETQRHSEHLAQTLKLSELLHSGLELEQVLEQIAQGVLELGFQVAINVREPEGELVRVRAVTGMEGPERETLMRATYHWSDFQVLMQERFQISHSYFIRQGELDWEKDFRGVSIPAKMEDRGPGYWRPEDSLLVPLWGTRGEPLGLLSVDEPADGLLPDLNTIQTLEAFANQAAIAIENARLFEDIEERRMYLEGVLGAAPDAIVTMDAHHRIVEWNSGAERLFGNSWEEVVGQNIDDLITSPDVFEEATEFTQVVTGGMEVSPTETVRYRKDGSPVDVIVAGSPILVGDKLIGAVAVYTDITARKRMEEALLALSLIDELTGLYNRRGFVILSQHQLKMANRARKRMLLLFADFDDLKAINDAFGHPEGDRALIEVADALRETFRESDIIARIGGDEFVVLAMEISRDNARIITTRLQENLEARNARAGRLYKLSLGVGIALYDPEQPCSINDLMAQADKAMYEHKRDSSLRYPETSPHPSPLPNGAREHVPSPSQGEG